jgi:signal transduction histidine kinase
MLSVRRLKELTATLRFRLVLWITLVVLLLDVSTNIIVRELEQRVMRHNYDQFLLDSMDEVSDLVTRSDSQDPDRLQAALIDRVKSYEKRSWFVELFNDGKQPLWASSNAPDLPRPNFKEDTKGPFNEERHRVYERRLRMASGETWYFRCGFLQIELQDDIDQLNRDLLLASLSTLLVMPLGGYLIALRATRPINQIITTTAQLQPADLNERLPIRGTGDEIDQLSRTINGMLDRLATFIDHNRDFVANAAHELRSPLAAIRTSVEVGLNQSRTQEEYTAILADVMEETGRLADLVNRLLILAEGDAGRIGGRDHQTRLDKVIRESVEMFDAVADAKGVRLTIGDLAPALVPGDETGLRQVTRNLIDNAIKYNRENGAVVVHLRLDQPKRNAYLVVQDTGIGIDQAMLPRVFERFYRADKSRTRENERSGYGLGLSICQTIIQALGGEITVESQLGRGSSFTVRLPLAERTVELEV